MSATIHQQIRAQLLQLYDEDDAFEWLQRPQPILDGGTPLLMISSGQGEKVRDALQAVLDGAFL